MLKLQNTFRSDKHFQNGELQNFKFEKSVKIFVSREIEKDAINCHPSRP